MNISQLNENIIEKLKQTEDMKYYLKNQTINRKPEKFYISQLGHGCFGTVIYIIPFMCIFPVIKELYRLEINLRGLEEEKKKRDYYNLLF